MDPPPALIQKLRDRVAQVVAALEATPQLHEALTKTYGSGAFYEAFELNDNWERCVDEKLVYQSSEAAVVSVGDLAAGAVARDVPIVLVIDAQDGEDTVQRATWWTGRVDPIIEQVQVRRLEAEEMTPTPAATIERWVTDALPMRAQNTVLYCQISEGRLESARWFNEEHEAVASGLARYLPLEKEHVLVWMFYTDKQASAVALVDTRALGPPPSDELVVGGVVEDTGSIGEVLGHGGEG
jgi:hypothetical protein